MTGWKKKNEKRAEKKIEKLKTEIKYNHLFLTPHNISVIGMYIGFLFLVGSWKFFRIQASRSQEM